MIESMTKLVWALLIGAFAMGGWVTGIQLTLNNHDKDISSVQGEQTELKKDLKKVLEVVIRSDERLKNLERRSQ